MNNSSRKKKSIINIFTNVGYQIFSLVTNFLSRTIFIHTLGTGFLGINGLFSNILSILSLAELGVGTAIVYSMYKPLAEKDEKKLAALTNYYGKLYKIIAFIVLLVGISIIPFLSFFINLENDINYIYIYYLLFLIDTVISYLCVYKASIINADQKMYKLNIIRCVFDSIRIILQIFLLVLFKNYMMYICVQIFSSIIYNIFCSIYAEKKYPYIKNKEELKSADKKLIWNNIFSMFSYKIGGVILNNTDQLLISILVSTEVVGLYSNYYMPVKAVMGITSAIFIAVQASIGNLSVDNDSEKLFNIFKILDFSSFWIYGFCAVCFAVLLQDFIYIWLGSKYMLSQNLVYIISITYYFTGVLYPIWCYRETVGLFKHTKNILFYSSIINLFLSLILGEFFGIEGILFATIVARILTNMWFEPFKLFKLYFNKNVFKYFAKKIYEFLLLVFCVLLINYISSFILLKNIYGMFIIKLLICFIVTNFIIILTSFKTEQFQYLVDNIKRIIFNKLH